MIVRWKVFNKGRSSEGDKSSPGCSEAFLTDLGSKTAQKKEAKSELWVKIICFTPETKSSHCEAPPDAGGSTSQGALERVHKYPRESAAAAAVIAVRRETSQTLQRRSCSAVTVKQHMNLKATAALLLSVDVDRSCCLNRSEVIFSLLRDKPSLKTWLPLEMKGCGVMLDCHSNGPNSSLRPRAGAVGNVMLRHWPLQCNEMQWEPLKQDEAWTNWANQQQGKKKHSLSSVYCSSIAEMVSSCD